MKGTDGILDLSSRYEQKFLEQTVFEDWEKYYCNGGPWSRILEKGFPSPALLTRTLLSLSVAVIVYAMVIAWLYVGSLWGSSISDAVVLVCNSDLGFSNSSTVSQNTTDFLTAALGDRTPGKLYAELIANASTGSFVTLESTACNAESITEGLYSGQYLAAVQLPANFSDSFSSYFVANASLSYTSRQMTATVYGSLALGLAPSIALNASIHSVLSSSTQDLSRTVYNLSVNDAQFASVVDLKILADGVAVEFAADSSSTSLSLQLATFVMPIVSWLCSAAMVAVLARYVALNLEIAFTPLRVALSAAAVMLVTVSSVAVCLLWMVPLVNPSISALCSARMMGESFGVLLLLTLTFTAMNTLLARLVGVRQLPALSFLALSIQVVTSQAYYPSAFQNRFYLVGKAFPMYYAVQQLRSVFYGVSTLSATVNYLVIASWLLGCTLLTIALHKRSFYPKLDSLYLQVLHDLSR